MRDAEFLAAMNALWLHQNLKMNALSQSRRPKQTFLAQVIGVYMSSIERGGDEDVIRAFFRTQVRWNLPPSKRLTLIATYF